jgi:UDP-N-acetyl-D-mannosaminuronate dehydrogenase
VGGDLSGRRILLLGVSYRQDVGDTRYSPSETFVRGAQEAGAVVVCHDPLVERWEELDMDVERELPPSEGVDVVVLAVPHQEYRDLDLHDWLGDDRPAVVDAFDVLDPAQRRTLEELGCPVVSIGRGIAQSEPGR